jgi:hypothetical protein
VGNGDIHDEYCQGENEDFPSGKMFSLYFSQFALTPHNAPPTSPASPSCAPWSSENTGVDFLNIYSEIEEFFLIILSYRAPFPH